MHPITEATEQTVLRVAGFDYPKAFAQISESGYEYRFHVCVVNLKCGYIETIEIESTKDCPVHLRQLVRKHMKGWQVHSDVPTKLMWQQDF